MNLVPCFPSSPLSVQSIMLQIGLIASLFALSGQIRQVLLKACEINAVMKRKDSNCVVDLSYQGEAETASNLSEYTITGNRL